MLGWLRRQWAQRDGVTRGNGSLHQRFRLIFEQLEERTVPSASPLGDLNAGALNSAPTFLNGERWFTELTFSNGLTRIFFVANTAATGEELWMTDGTPAGTTLVRDIVQGTGSSSPRFLTNVNGTLFFAANDGQSGFELWTSDGTASGTTRVVDIRGGTGAGSDPRFLVNVDGTLFFAANDGQNGFELWRSGGTAATTQMVANLNAGAASSNPHWLINANNILFFAADPGGNPPGFQLFRLDPATNSPTAIPDPTPISVLNPNPRLRNPRWPVYFPDQQRLFFIGEERTNAGGLVELRMWYINQGATIAPQRVIDVVDPGNDGFFLTAVQDPTTGRDFLFWRDRRPSPFIRLWVLDPGVASPGVTAVSLASDPFDLHNHNGVLMFSQGQGIDREPAFVDTRGQTLSSLSATLLANINPTGPSLTRPIYFPTDFAGQPALWNYLGTQATWYHWQSTVFFTSLGGSSSNLGLLYFAANDGVNGIELWRANNTLSAVNMVLTVNNDQIAPGPRSSVPRFLAAGAGSLLFSATGNDPSGGAFLGEEPWIEIGPPRILRVLAPPARIYRMRDVLQFIVVMDKPTLVSGTPKLNLILSDTSSPALQQQNVQASYVSGSGSRQLIFRYTVLRGHRDLDGIEIASPLDLSNGTITNIVGDQGDGQFTPSPQAFAGVRINGLPPWVLQVKGPPVGTYGVGDILTFQLITSEVVTAVPSGATNQIVPYLNIRIGNVTRQAYLVGGSGTNTLTFRYKVVAGDYAPEGIYLDPTEPFNAGTYNIRAPSITLPAPAPNPPVITGPRDLDTAIRTPVLFRVYVDTRGPRISNITLPGLRNYVTGQVLEFRFRFNETVFVRGSSGGRPTLRLQVGSAVRHATLTSGHATNVLTFRYTIQAHDQDLDGIRILGFHLPSGVRITDAVGNLALLTFTPPDTRLIRVNVPTIRL
ncbi:MAG: hypothetical protein RMJ19_07865 [Gemmatales bacterium]|nr:hypothetical protein [Gemmatales bacterium]MDW8175572.1 hypothetical protein [Gemmatales bacterium]